MKQVRIVEAFTYSFEVIRRYPMLLLAPPILISLLSSTFDIMTKLPVVANVAISLKKVTTFDELIALYPVRNVAIFLTLFLVLLFLIIFVSISLDIGRIRIAIHFFEKKEEEPTWDFYKNYGKGIIGRYFLASLQLGLMIFAGLMLFILPGIIVALIYQFVLFILVEKGVSVIDAFKISYKLTNGVKWQLLGYNLLVVFLSLIFLIPLSMFQLLKLNIFYYLMNIIVVPTVGIFLTLASIFIYKDISSQQDEICHQIEGTSFEEDSTEIDFKKR